jgi:4-amino-4-deoxy-L-arabinose transferase-like glycosyltransferase
VSPAPPRPRSTLLTILLLWIAFYASSTLFIPALLDDADSVHAEVAREMLLRHDYVTLYANGIRYLEKAPLLYWSMAASMRLSQLLGAPSPRALTVAARIPLSLTVLALALLIEAFARRLFRSTRAGLYAALITLSSFGIFIFTRILLPDADICLWTTLALYCFWRTEELTAPQADSPLSTQPHPDSALSPLPHADSALSPDPHRDSVISTEAQRRGEVPVSSLHAGNNLRLDCYVFAAACALNVLSKGLIGLVFPTAIVALYLLITRGLAPGLTRLRQLHPVTSALVFLALAAPWHILAGLANPTQGTPAAFHFVRHHWQVPIPTDGNVHGWFWFYFMNEHLLRYLNLRVPHDYDTSPLWLFWGLCLIWLMPWSAFLFKAAAWAAPLFGKSPHTQNFRDQLRHHDLPIQRRGTLLLLIWGTFVLLFFAFSTRQEYYVLPALPALAILIAGWLVHANIYRPANQPPLPRTEYTVTQVNAYIGHSEARDAINAGVAAIRITTAILIFGILFATAAIYILLQAHTPSPNTDLATLLTEHPSNYALSMGHFLDLDTRALGLFRLPLTLAVLSLFLGPLAAFLFRRRYKPHAANLALAAGAFTFLLAAHLGLQTFAPVLTSAQLAEAIAPQVHPQDLICIHGEYEAGSTLAFYLQRPSTYAAQSSTASLAPATNFVHILEGRSSNLWYGSFFPDAPKLFETPTSLAAKWPGPQRIFLWQSLTDPPNQLPALPGPVYILVKSGGKEIVSNQPNR